MIIHICYAFFDCTLKLFFNISARHCGCLARQLLLLFKRDRTSAKVEEDDRTSVKTAGGGGGGCDIKSLLKTISKSYSNLKTITSLNKVL
jgi:hypothetical protein